jgi:hypothetical protein
MRMVEPLHFVLDVPSAGFHDVMVYRSDASVMFNGFVIETILGAAGQSLLGPAESPNSFR